MRQKIDITDVESATKIRAKYLRALENEEFDVLHGGTFVRSFLRTYAQYLGLDAQRLIEDYRLHHEPRDPLELQPIAPRPQQQRDQRARRPPGRGALVAVVLIGLLGFLLVLGLTAGEPDKGGDGNGSQQAATSRQDQSPERAPAAPDGNAGSERRTAARVRVQPTAPVYVCWDRGPGTAPREIATLSRARTFRGRRIRLNIGNPSARVTANGRALQLDGPGPFGFDVRPRRVTEIPAGERPCA